MKKLSLLPLTLLPLSLPMAIVSCNKPTTDPYTFYVNKQDIRESVDYLYSNTIHVVRDQDYQAIIRVKDFHNWPENQNECSIWISQGEQITAGDVEIKNVYVDEQSKEWSYVSDPELGAWMEIHDTPITSTSTIITTFSFEIERDITVSFTNLVLDPGK